MTLGEALKAVSYVARLQVLKRNENGDYDYLFPKDELVRRDTLEKFHPDLLSCELTNGFHAEGVREGLYIHI